MSTGEMPDIDFIAKLIEGLLMKEGVKDEHAARIAKTVARVLSTR